MWSDPDLKPYMAVTAHWLENVQSPGGEMRLTLRASLIGLCEPLQGCLSGGTVPRQGRTRVQRLARRVFIARRKGGRAVGNAACRASRYIKGNERG
jgi:hypothetical protein